MSKTEYSEVVREIFGTYRKLIDLERAKADAACNALLLVLFSHLLGCTLYLGGWPPSKLCLFYILLLVTGMLMSFIHMCVAVTTLIPLCLWKHRIKQTEVVDDRLEDR